MPTYSIGTAAQYDALPLPPIADFTNGGWKLNTNFAMEIGDKVVYSGLKFTEDTNATSRFLTYSNATTDDVNAWVSSVYQNETAVGSTASNTTTTAPTNIPLTYTGYTTTGTAAKNLGRFFNYWTNNLFGRVLTKRFDVKRANNIIVATYLGSPNDYNRVPTGCTQVGTVVWYKQAPDKLEIKNYLTPALFMAAVPAPGAGIVVEILDATIDGTMLEKKGYDVRYTYSRRKKYSLNNYKKDYGF